MGSYMFANNYLNIVIPLENQNFKPNWLRYYQELPKTTKTFAFIDPAISQEEHADYTGYVVVDVDVERNWYVRLARRERLTPSQIIDLIFEIHKVYKPSAIGLEDVAYQKMLLYVLDDEVKKRGIIVPIKGIKPPTEETKETRILSMVPRFEWNRCWLNRGLQDLEMELLQFPRGAHDDIIDALAYIELIASYPEKEKEKDERPNPNDADNYEKWYRQNIDNIRRQREQSED